MTSPPLHKTYPTVDLHGAFLRRTSLVNARLRNANLTNADFSHADLSRSDFLDARLNGTILRGANLTDATNLTLDQLSEAIIDEHTKLPLNIDRQRLLARSRSTEGAGMASRS